MQGQGGSQDFWLLDLATKKSRPLTHLNNSSTMRTFDITPDGKQTVFDRLRENSDIVLNMMRQLNKEFGQTIIMITHNAEAAARADRVIEMRDGHVVRLTAPAEAFGGRP